MQVIFKRSFQTSCVAGNGFTAGEVYDLSPSAAAYWKQLGEAVDAPPPSANVLPAELSIDSTPAGDQPADPSTDLSAARGRRRP